MDSGLLEQWTAFAAARTEAFDGMNARSGRGGAVHAVAAIQWLAGVEIPGAACHTAVLGGELASLEPTAEPITCRRCLGAAGVAGELLVDQPTLF